MILAEVTRAVDRRLEEGGCIVMSAHDLWVLFTGAGLELPPQLAERAEYHGWNEGKRR